MKIEMGESLIYSWLRHVKECQIVQTNWKSSPRWVFNHKSEIENMLNELDGYFSGKYGFKVFKNNVSLDQIIQQGECDVLGINVMVNESGEGNHKYNYYAVDVAYHQNGLQYGSKYETVLKVIAKSIRTIFGLYGYFGAREGEVIFASPKVGKNVYKLANPLIDYLNEYFKLKGFNFDIRFIYNEAFDEKIIKPIVLVSKDVADTSELFMRSYQLIDMFSDITKKPSPVVKKKSKTTTAPVSTTTVYDELKIGQIARTILKDILETKNATDKLVEDLQDGVYCKNTLSMNLPVLVKEGKPYDKKRYYSFTVEINGVEFYLCNDWYERSREKLIDLIEKNK